MKFKFISILLFASSINCFSQNDVEVVLHQNMVNKVLRAIGSISDTSSYKILFFKGTYKWTVIDPKIELKANGKAEFKCDIQVEAGFFCYRDEVIGDADVWYDRDSNLVKIQIKHGLFEVYTHIFGAKMHIKDVDLAEFYTTPLAFEGPRTIGTSVEFTMPNESKKTIYAVPYRCDLAIEEKKIVLKCDMQFLDKDPSKKY